MGRWIVCAHATALLQRSYEVRRHTAGAVCSTDQGRRQSLPVNGPGVLPPTFTCSGTAAPSRLAGRRCPGGMRSKRSSFIISLLSLLLG